jgi:hypothetical protein
MLVRTQISLPPDDHRRAKERAAELGVSLAEYIRKLIARDLDEPPAKADVTALFNLGSSGYTDVARNHDAHVAEALEARFPRHRR